MQFVIMCNYEEVLNPRVQKHDKLVTEVIFCELCQAAMHRAPCESCFDLVRALSQSPSFSKPKLRTDNKIM